MDRYKDNILLIVYPIHIRNLKKSKPYADHRKSCLNHDLCAL
jgi:hypothetical protein